MDVISDMEENAISIDDTSAPQNLDKLLFQKWNETNKIKIVPNKSNAVKLLNPSLLDKPLQITNVIESGAELARLIQIQQIAIFCLYQIR